MLAIYTLYWRFFVGSGNVQAGAATSTGAGTFAMPTYTGSGNVQAGAATASGAGTFTAPVYTGSGNVTAGAATCSGVGTFTGGGAAQGGKLVHHPMPDWYSLAAYKYSIADEIRRREEEEIMVLIDA